MANNDLNQIRIFVQVAKLQSFTRAAEILGLEKSTVSSKVSQLEARLQIRLLQRTTRSVSLTEAGEQYLSYCEQALSALQLGDEFIANLNRVPSGRLRVSVPHNFVDFVMPTVIMPFLQKYPEVDLEIIESSRHVDLIKEHFDIAIRPSTEPVKDSSLVYRKIHHAEWVIAASRQHIDLYGLPATAKELACQPSIGSIGESKYGQEHQVIYWHEQKIVLNHRLAVNNMNSVRLALKAGLGFALIPKNMIKKELMQGELLEICPDIELKPTSLYVVYPSRSGQPAKLKAFVDALKRWGEELNR
ncbi:LysR family transcriptional regulator [Thalassomonas viridans]|uniref:LysR family transcriptional regulator n=1 Tax=Thalassomonas viridans TaxID=137584 RepID=A0AAF0CEC6_9GAMM|nr:LysR family transcriptional regulator [Thalassomonas viridans]WDE09150.1 LysR family transcriptional regulator [Thalassomonas viridans]